MCGIVAYIGTSAASSLLLEGLKRLEYRGYDSAGLAVLDEAGELRICKTAGRVMVLEERVASEGGMAGVIGIAHTRWATHGEPNDVNAHPHTDSPSDGHGIALVHNGIIENYRAIKTYLEERGHVFTSETDTEVLTHLIGELYDGDLEAAVQTALKEVTGAYAIAVVCRGEPGVLVAARKGAPLMVGVGQDEYIVASDSSAIVAHTKQAVELEDVTMVRLTNDAFRTTTVDNVPVTTQLMELEVDLEQIELGDFDHYMLKEIHEQPEAIRRSFRGRIDQASGRIVLGGVADYAQELMKAKRIVLLGQGTALHSAMVGEYIFEDLAGIPAETDFASEFRYRNPIVEDGTVVIAITQSGETLDTLEAMREARQRGALTLGLVNVVGSTIARETDAGVYLRVGPEIGVASTKAFIGQLATITMLAAYVGRMRHLPAQAASDLLAGLQALPDHIQGVIDQSEAIRDVTAKYIARENWLFLGRGFNFPVALEGALKLKEISYIHAEGMPAAEMKHGPIALIDEGMPVVFVATRNSQYEKVVSNIQEVRSRGGHVIAVATEGDEEIRSLCEDVFYVPDVPEVLQPMLTVVPLQLLAYHAAVLRGKDVDKPRNLAKSVTVE
ncbi:MAG: glutamine--fructose-6-phosphate transaminase (isomerizing) [Planctomycetota bacterium]|nr:glutamine--fructose-6-phosphate transaminase (isomerizing) [Planctomycetota bacterium]